MTVAADLLDRAVQLSQRLLRGPQQLLAGGGELEGPGTAHEERPSDLPLQGRDLPADRRLREIEFLRRQRERQQACRRLETAQGGKRDGAAALARTHGATIHAPIACMNCELFVCTARRS